MKKITLIILILANFSSRGKGQTFAEWTQQKKTQIKYLEQQIVGLDMYMGYLQKGYNTAREVLSAIANIRMEDFDLHKNYFNTLREINPSIKKYIRIADIISLQQSILNTCKKTVEITKENTWFTFQEASYIQNVFSKLLYEASADINQLVSVITTNNLIMKDDERIVQINHIYDDMLDKHSFVENFSNEVVLLGKQRLNESQDVETSRLLNHLNK